MSYTLSSGNMASKILYVNSEDASQYLATKLNSDGTTSPLNCYFNYTLKESIEVPANQRAIISLNSATIPYSFYNIRLDVNDTIDLRLTNVNQGTTYTPDPIVITSGNYDVYSFAEFIINKLSIQPYQNPAQSIEYDFTMTFSTDSQKYTYTLIPKNSSAGDVLKLELLFNTGINTLKKPFIELGFRVRDVEIISNQDPVISDNVVDMNGSVHGVYIRTNLVSNGTLDSQNGVFSNILSRLPINVNAGGIIFATPNEASHKSIVDLRSISQLTIRLTDDRNRLLDLNGLHFQIAIEINFIYAMRPSVLPDGRNIDDSFYSVKSDMTPQKRILNAQRQQQLLEEQERENRNRRGPGRPRRVGRPKGSTTKIND
jgi:hypothetical protein